MPLRLEPVRDRKLYRLVKAARERSTSRGQVLFRRGDPGGEVYLVRAGHVCLRLGESEGEGEGEGEAVRLPHCFTHRELADLAGAHRSTVTTSLNDWIWRGVLDTRRRSLLVTRPGLAALRVEGRGHLRSVDPSPYQD